jgi:chromosome segregation ATPase
MYVSELLERCRVLAERSARLYRQLASRFAHDFDRRELCHELAFLEETHANVLREEAEAFRQRDEAGDFLPELGQRVEALEKQLAELEARAADLQSPEDAFATLLALQQTNLEELYDELVLQGDPTFRVVVERLEGVIAEYPRAQAVRSRLSRRKA